MGSTDCVVQVMQSANWVVWATLAIWTIQRSLKFDLWIDVASLASALIHYI